jgi:CubicO group peptidase (beta-lactamase class C family)
MVSHAGADERSDIARVIDSFYSRDNSAGAGRIAANNRVAKAADAFYKKNGLAGLSVCVQRNGRTDAYYYGYGNFETRDRVTKDTVFRIASVSKLFTTLAILRLKDQGKLSLDDPLSRYVSEFPHGDKITIRDMLQHTSGIPNFAAFDQFVANPAKPWKPNELVDLLRACLNGSPLDFEPGTKAEYSNSNFMLLGVIVESASGMPFKDFVNKWVATPLGMTNTGVGSDSEIVLHRAAGYELRNGKMANAPFVSVEAPFATGDFVSQPRDLVKLIKAFKPGFLLSRGTIDEMSRPVVLKDGTTWIGNNEKVEYSFGYCWELVRPKGKREWIYTKGGAIDGFFAYVLYFKGSDMTVAVCANTQGDFSLLDLGLKVGEVLGAVR